ncbi:SDR family NAD(P)-dependent oxidoreductase [Geodermatophilus sabuli]|uniref:Pyridoxal 4-dehydrogenase n=1 Tax=Geodermatophilus sabuli TaxID=1564158 RepID=A0A285EFE8_9ACTN|nr:SDR family oxidoreductase [Geodermatophilus sabuli]MBB3086573.1 NAD(P)-dependent dehydrogenase (short-subunit alcohol dehydrogenase family) [Geodermatophilus sabuli]SNX97775.1 pyridoxal 4-dehydrogenase [Geodermatophilus sabuli]
MRATTAVVTGGARGIGRALAERLRADGHRVTVLDVVEPDDAATTDWIRCDVTEPDQLQAAMTEVADAGDGIDVLVNNAGLISPRRPYLESGKEELLRYLTVNAVGYALATQAAHPYLVAGDRGCVVNVASRTFFTGSPGQLAYVASKGAVLGMTRVLAQELGPHGVTVNAVMPGQVATPGTEQYNSEEDFDRTMAQQAIRRRVQPEDLAGLVSFLCGPDARMVTGQTIVCDGGGYLH